MMISITNNTVVVDGRIFRQVEPKPQLNERQWGALANAEDRIYGNEEGAHAYTSVCDRVSDDGYAAQIWAQAEMAVEALNNDFDGWPEESRLRAIAWRVAQSLAVISFGPEILLK